jgi:hypothetical protein
VKLRLVIIAILAAGLTGCLAAPTVPVTPSNASQVSVCETNANVHNATWIIGGALGAATAGLGTAGTLTDNLDSQRAIAGAAIGTGVLAVVATAVDGVTAANYQAAGCASLVTPLQSQPGK